MLPRRIRESFDFFTRKIREIVYHYNRKKCLRNENFARLTFDEILNRRNSKRKGHFYRQQQDFRIFAIIGVIFLCIFIFTKCFGGSAEEVIEETIEVEEKIEEVEIKKTSFNQEIIEEKNQDDIFEIKYKDIADIIQLALEHAQPIHNALGAWHYETLAGTSNWNINQIIKNGASVNQLYEEYSKIYDQFIYDLKYFPVAAHNDFAYGEGILLDPKSTNNTVEVVSMTAGVVVNKGWTTETGYTIMIESIGGALFQYGHLYKLPQNITIGQEIVAGHYLGRMGNTAGFEEGTQGNVPVSLSLSCTVKYMGEEMNIDIFPFLEWIENKRKDIYS
ncbi:hypothetical protein AN639_07960 [Candidatus Epulonipiscium fishelsonii]|uniref:Uncharacterized protein n=1 Tax=Candidatus Epulonipiscium fishelsonii TaxID=77094 RepID=A0ACC8X7R5_9FIRM|nr:hypothetical protein AN396_12670 [Epulopiscium sp. SCG-B11WGA-EpuloA1]ONI38324.1 hypothetical protein AN639_07960 [Epulopiscium sp. SCG-B05WGA-EpuloA1]